MICEGGEGRRERGERGMEGRQEGGEKEKGEDKG